MVLEKQVGPKPVDRITRRDIARFLGDASNKATRKRRLTSARRFFQFLIDERVLQIDPTEGYFPHHIELRLPVPLFPDEQDTLLAAAAEDEPWSELAIWLMLKLGLTRSELLGLDRDHVDRTDESRPLIYIFYQESSKQSKERTLAADSRFAEIYDSFLTSTDATGQLVKVGPPAVNSMVERVRRIAGIEKMVTPQVLRHSFAVDAARAGADQTKLLNLLGLSDDPRNRESVDRYLRLAIPVNEADTIGG
jgi:integrase/recombinase XerD